MIQGRLNLTATSFLVEDSEPLTKAMEVLDRCKATLTLVVTNGSGKVVGTVTDGDIRRWLLRTIGRKPIDFRTVQIRSVMHDKPVIIRPDDSWFQRITEARAIERDYSCHIRVIPIVDENDCFVDVLDLVVTKQRSRLDAILMAKTALDGEGCRLCKTNEDVENRRDAFDTIRYETQIAKYSALTEFVDTGREFKALEENRRIYEVYSALRRGGNWAAQALAPGREAENRLQQLKESIATATKTLLKLYMRAIPVSRSIGSPVAYRSPNYIFVLGSTRRDEGRKRVAVAAKYLSNLRTLEGRWVVLSGGGRGSRTEAKQMKSLLPEAIRLKLKNRLILEEDSLDTVGNAIFGWMTLVKRLRFNEHTLRSVHGSKITVVTSDYHALRALDLFSRVFAGAEICVCVDQGSGKTEYEDEVRVAMSQLDSEVRANIETFCLESVASGSRENISNRHVRSMFFQLIKYHDQYKWRYDLVRKYKSVLEQNGKDSVTSSLNFHGRVQT